MLYWFQVYLLVAITIFALAGGVLLSLMLGTILKGYIRTQLSIRQIAGSRVAGSGVSGLLRQAS